MHEIVVIDSWNRVSGSSTDFKYKLNKSIRNINKIELLHVNLSNTFYTFNDSQFFRITEDLGADFSVQMPNKSLSIDELISFLNTEVNAHVGSTAGYTFSYDESTFKITMTHSTRLFSPRFFPNSPYKAMGFPEGWIPPNAASHTSLFTVSLEATDYIMIGMDKIATVCSSKRAIGNFIVPINVPRGEVQQFNKNTNFEQVIECNSLDLSDGHILIINDNGNIAKSDELNIKIVLKLTYC